MAIGLLRADLAARVRVEEQLRRANERWNLIVKQMPLAFIERNLKTEIIGWNPQRSAHSVTRAKTCSERLVQPIVPEKHCQEIEVH